jgi:imidazolonepropionase
MNEIGVVTDGALLIHNGAIQESGPSRRIENLQQARAAREIDAGGKIVMPAFVDPDAALVTPPGADVPLRVVSRRRLEVLASSSAAAYTRLGALSLGAHTRGAGDLRETIKTLLIHQSLQNKPLRIRSILSPRRGVDSADLIEKWLPAVRARKLAAILELTGPVGPEFRRIAMAGAAAGFSLRIRAAEALDDSGCEFALAGGAVAIIAPAAARAESLRRLSELGCVHVLTAGCALTGGGGALVSARGPIDEGAAIALASGFSSGDCLSFNPQFLLYLAEAEFRMTPEEAICATTWNAACSLRMSHVTGSLEPGKSADLLVMDVGDYRELSRRPGHSDVSLAIRAGRIVYRRAPLILD